LYCKTTIFSGYSVLTIS